MCLSGVLPCYQGFLKKLQHEKPLVHALHAEMVGLVRDVLSKFMKPEAIPLQVSDLLRLDIGDRNLQLPDKGLFVGRYSFSAMTKARVEKQIWIWKIYSDLREGYIKSATFLLKNLPLKNKVISAMSVLTPSLMSHASAQEAFITLAKALPNIVESEELGQLDEEVRAYQIDEDL